MRVKITHRKGYHSAIDTYISTDVASFNVFTIINSAHGTRIACISAAKGWRESRDVERYSDADWEEALDRSKTPYEFVRRFWADCLAERFAGVEL